MFYLGSHKGSTDDGYTGSGRRFRAHYHSRPEDFKRRILEYVDGSVAKIWEREAAWLSLIKPEELNTRYMNQKLTAIGGAGPRSEETKRKIKNSSIGIPKWTAEQKQQISARQLGVPKSNGAALSKARRGIRTGPFSEERKVNVSKGKYQRVSCNGLEFPSGKHAAKYFNIATTTVSARLRNSNFPDWFKIDG